jgi:hypothetical protein
MKKQQQQWEQAVNLVFKDNWFLVFVSLLLSQEEHQFLCKTHTHTHTHTHTIPIQFQTIK